MDRGSLGGGGCCECGGHSYEVCAALQCILLPSAAILLLQCASHPAAGDAWPRNSTALAGDRSFWKHTAKKSETELRHTVTVTVRFAPHPHLAPLARAGRPTASRRAASQFRPGSSPVGGPEALPWSASLRHGAKARLPSARTVTRDSTEALHGNSDPTDRIGTRSAPTPTARIIHH